MYIRTTLASETLQCFNKILGEFREFGSSLDLLLDVQEDIFGWNTLTLEDRRSMLQFHLESIQQGIAALTHLYPVDGILSPAEKVMDLIRQLKGHVTTITLKDSYRLLKWSTYLEGGIRELSDAIIMYLGQTQLITPEFIAQEQVALHQVFVSVEGDLNKFEPAHQHFRKAIRYLREPPLDPENSIKEIVSTLESVGKIVYSNSTTLGDVVKEMRKAKTLPRHLITVIEKFYAYACDEPAVRHGGSVSSKVMLDDAEFCLHLGAALTQYLISSGRDRKI